MLQLFLGQLLRDPLSSHSWPFDSFQSLDQWCGCLSLLANHGNDWFLALSSSSLRFEINRCFFFDVSFFAFFCAFIFLGFLIFFFLLTSFAFHLDLRSCCCLWLLCRSLFGLLKLLCHLLLLLLLFIVHQLFRSLLNRIPLGHVQSLVGERREVVSLDLAMSSQIPGLGESAHTDSALEWLLAGMPPEMDLECAAAHERLGT